MPREPALGAPARVVQNGMSAAKNAIVGIFTSKEGRLTKEQKKVADFRTQQMRAAGADMRSTVLTGAAVSLVVGNQLANFGI